MIDKSVENELKSNWDGAYVSFQKGSVSRHANVISSHFVYKIKRKENEKKRLKARLCPHGNREKMKDYVRKDSATAQLDVIRLFCNLATILGFRLGCLDIQGAYMQSGPIQIDIYLRPPPEWKTPIGIIWKLIKLPYGITEAGRQWAKVFDSWLMAEAGFECVTGVPQLLVKRSNNRHRYDNIQGN